MTVAFSVGLRCCPRTSARHPQRSEIKEASSKPGLTERLIRRSLFPYPLFNYHRQMHATIKSKFVYKARVTSNPGVKYAVAYLSYNDADYSGSKFVTKSATWTSAELASGNWVQKYVTFQVPVGYNNVSISPYLYGHYGAGTVEYDDYRIEEFDSEPVGAPVVNQDSEVNFDS